MHASPATPTPEPPPLQKGWIITIVVAGLAGIVALLWQPAQLAFRIFRDFTQHQKTPDEVRQDFVSQRAAYETLRQMAKQDAKSGCFEAGTDKIGDFWRHGSTWTHQSNWKEKLALAQVLERTGMTKARYETYLKLLVQAKADRLSYCPPGRGHGWTRITVGAYGLAVSGLSISVNINDDGFVPETTKKDVIHPLPDVWYTEFRY